KGRRRAPNGRRSSPRMSWPVASPLGFMAEKTGDAQGASLVMNEERSETPGQVLRAGHRAQVAREPLGEPRLPALLVPGKDLAQGPLFEAEGEGLGGAEPPFPQEVDETFHLVDPIQPCGFVRLPGEDDVDGCAAPLLQPDRQRIP